jgi:hypothetical protein
VRAPFGSTVVVFVNARDTAVRLVPHVLGMSRIDAVDRLERAGFDVRVVDRSEPATVTARSWRDRVWRHTPVGASFANAGSTVTIWVAP